MGEVSSQTTKGEGEAAGSLSRTAHAGKEPAGLRLLGRGRVGTMAVEVIRIMIELLAVPAWDAKTTTLAQWLEALEGQGLTVSIVRESPHASWIEVNALSLRGYALMDGIKVEAVNFELTATDPTPARQALEAAATALAWEIDEDDAEDDVDED